MISEEEKQRYVEATKCSECTQGVKYCKAECCKIVFLNIEPELLDKPGKLLTIKPNKPLSFSDKIYYQMRGVECIRGFLRFQKENIIVVGRKIMYIYPCKLLNGNLCSGHPNKPDICKVLTLETAKLIGKPFELTDNCLFKFKCKEVNING